MTSAIEQEAANAIAPLLNKTGQVAQGVVAVTSASARENIAQLTAGLRGHFLTLHADGGDVYVAFNSADAGAIDDTATGYGVTICQRIPSGQDRSWRIPGVDSPDATAYQWLIHKTASGTAKLRLYISSLGQSENARDLAR